jgi:hypothetical protein
MARVFDAAKAAGLPVKLHADQLSNLHGAELAARYGALSADHLEYTDEAGAVAMARAGTVATILPGAYYFIRETRKPPIGLFRQHGVKMAVATDNNPGTSPLTSLLLTMNMAATLFGLTVDECLTGVTREAARALGLLGETGTLEAGKSADLAIWDIERPAELVYRMGFNPLYARIGGYQRTAWTHAYSLPSLDSPPVRLAECAHGLEGMSLHGVHNEQRESDHRRSGSGRSQSCHPARRARHRERRPGVEGALRWPHEWGANIPPGCRTVEAHEAGLDRRGHREGRHTIRRPLRQLFGT